MSLTVHICVTHYQYKNNYYLFLQKNFKLGVKKTYTFITQHNTALKN